MPQHQVNMKWIGLLGLLAIGLAGCGVWPVMTEEHGRRPFAMGKSDQVFLPHAPQPVHLSEEYGMAYRQALEGQIQYPAASNNLEPVQGAADPQALHYSLSRYQQGFKSPPFSDFDMKDSGSKGGVSGSGGSQTSSGGGKK